MNKKLGRYLEPASWVFFAVLGAFVVAAAAFQNFILAGCEAALTILLLALYLRQRKQHKAVLQNYLQSALAIPEAGTPALPPFPTVMVRLADGVITYANEDFASAADLHDGFTDRTITELVPELKLDWLTEGKHEFPFDVTVKGAAIGSTASRIGRMTLPDHAGHSVFLRSDGTLSGPGRVHPLPAGHVHYSD